MQEDVVYTSCTSSCVGFAAGFTTKKVGKLALFGVGVGFFAVEVCQLLCVYGCSVAVCRLQPERTLFSYRGYRCNNGCRLSRITQRLRLTTRTLLQAYKSKLFGPHVMHLRSQDLRLLSLRVFATGSGVSSQRIEDGTLEALVGILGNVHQHCDL